MKLRVSRGMLVTVTFLVVALVALGYTTWASLNYLDFYPALDQLAGKVAVLSLHPAEGSSTPELLAIVIISNPTGYVGLTIGLVELSFYFQKLTSNMTLYEAAPLFMSNFTLAKLGAEATVTYVLLLAVSNDQYDTITAFNNSLPGALSAKASLTFETITFLDPSIGRMSYTSTQDVLVSM
jgi:hypothetical protein